MRVLFIHNEEDKASRDFLSEVQGAGLAVEVLDFMAVLQQDPLPPPPTILRVRDLYRFRGTPCIWIGGDSPEDVVWQKAIDVTLPEIQEALSTVRELQVTAVPMSLAPQESSTITVTALDVDGNPASLPEGITITIGEDPGAEVIHAAEAIVLFEDTGVYPVKGEAPMSLPASTEVTVSA